MNWYHFFLQILAIVSGLALLSIPICFAKWGRRFSKAEVQSIQTSMSVWLFIVMTAGIGLIAAGFAGLTCSLQGGP